jgi:hypothetical protein
MTLNGEKVKTESQRAKPTGKLPEDGLDQLFRNSAKIIAISSLTGCECHVSKSS